MSKVVLFLNGLAPKKFPNLTKFKKIYCTDGSYNYLSQNNIQPDVVSGDFDSIKMAQIPVGIEVIHTPDQNFTDFEKALELILKDGFEEVHIYGSSGMEHDHFLGNLTTGLKFKDKLTLLFFDDFSYYFFSDKETILSGYKERIISLYPFPEANNIFTEGLKYQLKGENLSLSKRIGIRNLGISDEIRIRYKEGELLVFIRHE